MPTNQKAAAEKAENQTATADAAPAKDAPLAGFKVAKLVTLPLNKWKNDEPKYLKIESAIFQGKQITQKDGKTDEKPADLMNCVDLVTGEQCQVIVGEVLKGTLREEYENDGYVNKYFKITQHRDSGKKYNTYSIAELQPEA